MQKQHSQLGVNGHATFYAKRHLPAPSLTHKTPVLVALAYKFSTRRHNILSNWAHIQHKRKNGNVYKWMLSWAHIGVPRVIDNAYTVRAARQHRTPFIMSLSSFAFPRARRDQNNSGRHALHPSSSSSGFGRAEDNVFVPHAFCFVFK